MSAFDDDLDMNADRDELLLTGRPVSSEPELVAFVAALRVTAAEPAPRPSLALAALLRDGLAPPSTIPTPVRPVPAHRARSRMRDRLRTAAGLGLAAKILLGAGVAVASVAGAATIDAVPDVVQRPASALVSGVVDLFGPAPVQDAPGRPAPQPSETAKPEHAPEPAPAPAPKSTTPATVPSAAPSVPVDVPDPTPAPAPTVPVPLPVDPPVDLPETVDPTAVPPVVRDLHTLLKTTTAPAAEVLAPAIDE